MGPSRTSLGELQLAIMRVLWECGEATTAEVHGELAERRLAPTTIATMLRKMEDKGVVRHRVQGRQFIYQPTLSEDEVKRSMVGEIVDRLFAGDPAALVSHLVSEHEIDRGELASLRRVLRQAGREGDR